VEGFAELHRIKQSSSGGIDQPEVDELVAELVPIARAGHVFGSRTR
jgi:hypothetical protein